LCGEHQRGERRAGVIKENLNIVVQTHRVRVNDAGPDNAPGNADDERLSSQGIYIP
jgi:hypothetical protein